MEDLGSFLREHKKWDRRFKLFLFLNLSSTLSDSAYGSYIYENLNIFLAVFKKKKNLFLAQYIIIFFTLNSSLKLYIYIYIGWIFILWPGASISSWSTLNLLIFFMALSNDVHIPCTGKMRRSLPLLQRLSLFSLVVLFFLHTCCYGDVGTAAQYAPPYLRKYTLRKQKEKSITQTSYSLKPYLAIYIAKTLHQSHTTIFWSIIATACYGSDISEFPASNLFAVAGDGIWDNGASCGRQYLVRCISASIRDACSQNRTIQIKIVDYVNGMPSPPSASNTTMILSSTAFGTIANSSTNSPAINIEFQQ